MLCVKFDNASQGHTIKPRHYSSSCHAILQGNEKEKETLTALLNNTHIEHDRSFSSQYGADNALMGPLNCALTTHSKLFPPTNECSVT